MSCKHSTTRIAIPPKFAVKRITFTVGVERMAVRVAMALTNTSLDNCVPASTAESFTVATVPNPHILTAPKPENTTRPTDRDALTIFENVHRRRCKFDHVGCNPTLPQH
jgi:hypothetical protein